MIVARWRCPATAAASAYQRATGRGGSGEMKPRNVRRVCAQQLRTLRKQGFQPPVPLDATGLCAEVSRCLAQPVTLVGMPMPARAPTGLTLWTDSGQIIAYDERAPEAHRLQIVGHELAHVIFNHRAIQLDGDDATKLLLPTLDPQVVHQILGRGSDYTELEECQAETLATMLLAEPARRRRESAAVTDPVHRRLAETLQDPRW